MHATDGHADNLEPGFNALEDGPADDGDPRLDALVEEFLKAQDDCRGDAEELHARVRALVRLSRRIAWGVRAVPVVGKDRRGPPGRTAGGGDGTRSTTRLRIEREYASGGMGRVYLAHDRDLGRTVALKVARKIVDGAWHDDAAARSRFLREATMTAGIGHPAVPPVHAVGRGDAPRTPGLLRFEADPRGRGVRGGDRRGSSRIGGATADSRRRGRGSCSAMWRACARRWRKSTPRGSCIAT